MAAAPVMATAMQDVCEVRAERLSGYSGDRSGLNVQIGKVKMRLSGSFAFGISHSSGPGVANGPAFVGASAVDQRDARAKRKYVKAFNACMQTG